MNGKSALLIPDGHRAGRLKRRRGNMTDKVGNPFVDVGQNKKSRAEEQTNEKVQSGVSKVQQVLTSSNQTQGNTEETRVVIMVDKVIHVSEVTSEKLDVLPILSQEPRDNFPSPTLGADQCNLHGETIDQSNYKTRQEDVLPCASSVLGSTEEISKGNNEQVSEHC